MKSNDRGAGHMRVRTTPTLCVSYKTACRSRYGLRPIHTGSNDRRGDNNCIQTSAAVKRAASHQVCAQGAYQHCPAKLLQMLMLRGVHATTTLRWS
jgi:hypothetical protein